MDINQELLNELKIEIRKNGKETVEEYYGVQLALYKDLDKYFVEIRENIKDCEFVGCTHIKEENCGVKKALEEGKINQGRYDRFCKIYQELKSREENKKW